MSKVISICKDGVRYDMPLDKVLTQAVGLGGEALAKGGPGSGVYERGGSRNPHEAGDNRGASVGPVRRIGNGKHPNGAMVQIDHVPGKFGSAYHYKSGADVSDKPKFFGSGKAAVDYYRGKGFVFPESVGKLNKQEPIASDEPVISEGAIVSLRGHKGKVLQTEGDQATVSWEDAALSKVPIKDLKYEGRVER